MPREWVWERHLPDSVVEEVAYRTPGFTGWQQEKWFGCCGDAAAYLGRAGKPELARHGPEALEAIRASVALGGPEWERFLDALRANDSPTAYLFRCLHCGRYGGYTGCD